jgi:hypothetical protein
MPQLLIIQIFLAVTLVIVHFYSAFVAGQLYQQNELYRSRMLLVDRVIAPLRDFILLMSILQVAMKWS